MFALIISGCGADDAKGNNDKPKDGEAQPTDNPLGDLFGDVKGLKSDNPKKVIAEYEGGKFTQAQYDQYVNVLTFISPQIIDIEKDEEFVKNIVDGYIASQVLAKRATEKLDTKKEAEQFLKDMKSQYQEMMGTEKQVKEYMEKLYITDKDVTEYYDTYRHMDSYLKSKISDDSQQPFYDLVKEDRYTTATVSHILVALAPNDKENKPTGETRTDEEALKRANEIIEKLNSGEDFGVMAKEYSDDWGSKENGGTYENADVSKWVPEFKEAALTLEINKVSEPVKTEYGYHVMKVKSRTTKTFDDVKAEILANADYYDFAKGQVYDKFIKEELPNIITKTDLPEVKKESK